MATKRGFAKVHVAHTGAAHKQLAKPAKRDGCGVSFYKSPSFGQSVDSSKPLDIAWDASCLPGTKAVDIYLFEPSAEVPQLYKWENVDYAKGAYAATLLPRWWNASASAQLYLSILPAGEPPFMQTLPAAPVWTATYAAPASGAGIAAAADTHVPDSGFENVGAMLKRITPGGIAAAVLLPLLALAAAGIYFYVRAARRKRTADQTRFSEALDKRMSRISHDWNSITPAGATAAIRHSMAFPGVVGGVGMAGHAQQRDSAFSFGAIRPSEDARASTAAVEDAAPAMSQLRPGLRQSAFAERQSRVISFADQPRPSDVRRSLASGGRASADTRRAATSRAFRDSFVPPVPARMDAADGSTPGVGALSPGQAQGAFTLTADDIRTRLAQPADAPAARPSVDEMMPALSLMRQGGAGGAADDALLPPPPPAPPVPAYSPVMSGMPMPTMPAHATTSPDDLLRAYATQRAAQGSAPTNGYGMRVLYAPPTTPSPFGFNQ